jgi:hypothetical protein
MTKRLEKLSRILRVQRDLHRAAELRLVQLKLREAAKEEEERQVVAALNDEKPLHGLFIDAMARHLRAASQELSGVRAARAKEALTVMERACRLKQTERAHSAAEREHRRAGERQELERLIDELAAQASDKPRYR